MRILFLSNIPSPYVVGYLNELGKYCRLTAVFEKASDRSRPDSWKNEINGKLNFRSVILKGLSVSSKMYGDTMGYAPDDKAISPSVIRYISRNYNLVIVGNPCTPTGIIEILYMRAYRIPYAIQSEGGFPGTGKGIKESIKRFLMSKAVLYFSTCEMGNKYFYTYGATEERIRDYVFTSMHKDEIPKDVPSDKQRISAKRKLGFSDDLLILSVGRSVPVKGYDILLRAFAGVRRREETKEVQLCIAGADQIQEYTKIIQKEKIENVVFTGDLPHQELSDYYTAADIFIFPTRGDTWGLVINEAMAFGLPIIVSDQCIAGSALIEDGKNGLIVQSEYVKGFRDAMITMIRNPEMRKLMGKEGFKKIQGWTLEHMGKMVYRHIREYVRNK